MNILRGKFPRGRKYSRKMVKERYLLYLKDNIRQEPWTVEEDIFLINMLAKGVKRWRMIADYIPGRTELHLKNRYYGYLREIERKVEKMMEKKLQKNKVKREA